MIPEREEFVLIQTLDPVKTGEVFRSIPPHVTMLSWFAIARAHVDELIPVLDYIVDQYGELISKATGMKRVKYGVDEDIPGCTLQFRTNAAHILTKRFVDSADGVYKYPEYAKRWSPHITDEHGVAIHPDQRVAFSSLVLVSRQDTENEKRKVVEYSGSLVSTQ